MFAVLAVLLSYLALLVLTPTIHDTATTGGGHAKVVSVQQATTLTDASSGADVEAGMGKGDPGFTLRLSHRRHWHVPRLAGRSITLERIDYLTDPGYDAWKIVPLRKGETTITATRPSGKPFTVTVHIS